MSDTVISLTASLVREYLSRKVSFGFFLVLKKKLKEFKFHVLHSSRQDGDEMIKLEVFRCTELKPRCRVLDDYK